LLWASLRGRFDGRGRVRERNRNHAMVARRKGQVGGELQGALGTDEIGLEARAEGIAAPGDSGNADAGFAEEGVVDGNGKRSLRRQLLHHGVADDGEDLGGRQPMLREDSIIRRPILEFLPTGGQQAGHGVTSQAKQTA